MRSLSSSCSRAGSRPSTLTRAAVGAGQALEDLDRRGLARAVWPEQAEDLAALDLERHAVDGTHVAIGLVQVGNGDDVRGVGHGRIVIFRR